MTLLLSFPPPLWILVAVIIGCIIYWMGHTTGVTLGYRKAGSRQPKLDIRKLQIDRKINKYQLANLPIQYKKPEDYVINVIGNSVKSITESIPPEYFKHNIQNHMDGDVTITVSLKIVMP